MKGIISTTWANFTCKYIVFCLLGCAFLNANAQSDSTLIQQLDLEWNRQMEKQQQLGDKLDLLNNEMYSLNDRLQKQNLERDVRKAMKIRRNTLEEEYQSVEKEYRIQRDRTQMLERVKSENDETEKVVKFNNYLERYTAAPPKVENAPSPPSTTPEDFAVLLEAETASLPNNRPQSKDPYLNPIAAPCNVQSSELDAFTGRRRIAMAPVPWFAYTPAPLKPYYSKAPYISAEMRIASLQKGPIFIMIDFQIHALDAERLFGQLDKGGVCDIKLFDGTNLQLPVAQTSLAEKDLINKTTRYRIQLMLNSSQLKQLEKSETDMIRLSWTSGYEEYPISHINALRDQLACLEAQNK